MLHQCSDPRLVEAGSNGNDTMMVGNDDSTEDTETAPPVVIVF